MNELFHSLGINWQVMVAQIVNFAILLFILGKFVYRPVVTVLEERRNKVIADKESSDALAQKLREVEVKKEQVLAEARKESERILASAKASGKEVRERMLAETGEEIAKQRVEEERRMKGEREKLLQSVKQEIGEVVASAVERSFGDILDEHSQGKMVEQALAVLREANTENPKHETLNSKHIPDHKRDSS